MISVNAASLLVTLYADATGAIVRVVDDTDTGLYATPPAAAVRSLVLDRTTNAAAVRALREAAADRVRLAADGTLTVAGTAVPIAPPGPAVVAAQNADTLRTRLAAQLDTLRADVQAVDADRQALVARLAAAAPTTLAGAVAQLRELQGFVRTLDAAYERSALATVRLTRLAANQLDALD